MKTCSRCSKDKPLTEFHKKGTYNSVVKYRSDCKKCRKTERRTDLHTVVGKLYHQALDRSRRHSREFTIDKAWIQSKIEVGVCEFTKLPFKIRDMGKDAWQPSLDRIDSNLGYTKENTRVVLWCINTLLHEHGDEVINNMLDQLMEIRNT